MENPPFIDFPSRKTSISIGCSQLKTSKLMVISPLPAPEITARPPSADPAAWLLPSESEDGKVVSIVQETLLVEV